MQQQSSCSTQPLPTRPLHPDPLEAAPSFFHFLCGWTFDEGEISLDEFVIEFFLKRGAPTSQMEVRAWLWLRVSIEGCCCGSGKMPLLLLPLLAQPCSVPCLHSRPLQNASMLHNMASWYPHRCAVQAWLAVHHTFSSPPPKGGPSV